MSLNFSVLPDVKADDNAVTIAAVRAYVIETKKAEGAGGGVADCHARNEGHWILGTNEWPIANPMSVYESYKARRNSWGKDVVGSFVVEIELIKWNDRCGDIYWW